MPVDYRSSKPWLPQEIINNILRQSDNPPFLWVACRQVCRAFCREVELIFRETWLPQTVIMWLRDVPLWTLFFECRLSRVSEDSETAYFKIQLAELLMVHPTLGDNKKPQNLNELEYLLWTHDLSSKSPAFLEKLRVVTRIGADTNNTYFSDHPLPKITVHEATCEISLNWKKLLTSAFHEEYLLATLKAKAGICTPATPPINLQYPIIIPRGKTNPFARNLPPIDFVQRCQVRHVRATRLGWSLPTIEYVRATNGDVVVSIARLETFQLHVRLSETFAKYKLQTAMCRGQRLRVEEPEKNGFKKWKRGGTRWYGNAWENPEDGGRTNWSKEEVVMEVERMARAWEKGSD